MSKREGIFIDDIILEVLKNGPNTTESFVAATGKNLRIVTSHVTKLKNKELIRRVDNSGKNALYEIIKTKSFYHGPIEKDEIIQTKNKAKIGGKIRVFNEFALTDEPHSCGSVVSRKIISKHRNLVLLDDGHSVTYVQLAQYYRMKGENKCIR